MYNGWVFLRYRNIAITRARSLASLLAIVVRIDFWKIFVYSGTVTWGYSYGHVSTNTFSINYSYGHVITGCSVVWRYRILPRSWLAIAVFPSYSRVKKRFV